MKNSLFLAMVLVGCLNTDPPRLWEFVEEWAHSTCTRQVWCGWTEDRRWCESQTVEFFCSTFDCDREYHPTMLEVACLERYETLECSNDEPVCRFGSRQ